MAVPVTESDHTDTQNAPVVHPLLPCPPRRPSARRAHPHALLRAIGVAVQLGVVIRRATHRRAALLRRASVRRRRARILGARARAQRRATVEALLGALERHLVRRRGGRAGAAAALVGPARTALARPVVAPAGGAAVGLTQTQAAVGAVQAGRARARVTPLAHAAERDARAVRPAARAVAAVPGAVGAVPRRRALARSVGATDAAP
eukprot:5884246-Prymnesium_polylepis.1